MSIAANWQSADALDYAWFSYSEPELQQRYRDCGEKPEAASTALQFEMRMELRERIGEGEFIALGILVSTVSDRQPVVIPSIFFIADSVQIDWDRNVVWGLEQKFSDVKICGAGSSSDQRKSVIDVETVLPGKAMVTKRGGGRSDLYVLAKPILDELFRDPAFAAMTANPLLEPFNRSYVARHSTATRRVAEISERSLRTYLKRYRQESAETGNNQIAN